MTTDGCGIAKRSNSRGGDIKPVPIGRDGDLKPVPIEDLIPYYKTLSPLLGNDLKRHLEDLLPKENATKPNEGDFQQTEKAEHNDNQESSES